MRRKGIEWEIVGVWRTVVAWRMVVVGRMVVGVSVVVEVSAVVGEVVIQMSWRETPSGWGNNGL